eukprot:4522305-Amphidinium_carterae.1
MTSHDMFSQTIAINTVRVVITRMGRSGGRFYELLKDLRQEHSKDVKELQEQLSRASQALQEVPSWAQPI